MIHNTSIDRSVRNDTPKNIKYKAVCQLANIVEQHKKNLFKYMF